MEKPTKSTTIADWLHTPKGGIGENMATYNAKAVDTRFPQKGLPAATQTGGPEERMNYGQVSIAIWKNERPSKNGGTYFEYSAQVQKSYKDKEGVWKNTNSFRQVDLHKLLVYLPDVIKRLDALSKDAGND